MLGGKITKQTLIHSLTLGPGIFEPVIQKNFPRVYPSNPMVGQNIRIECFASGT